MYIGIDLGTTACKAMLYNENGQNVAQFNKEYTLMKQNNFVEQDANLWFNLVKEAIAYVSKGYGHQVKALSISTQGISFVPVDDNGEPLADAISWLDTRAEKELQILSRQFSDSDIYNKTGKHLNGAYTLPKLMWFKNHFPDIYAKTYKFLMPLDFLNFKLCGKTTTDYSMACGTMMYNIHEKDWDMDILAFTGIDKSKLPDVSCMGKRLGDILPEIAHETGISKSTMVVLGGQDQKLAAIGSGIADEICTVSIGTATAITLLTKAFDINEESPQYILDDEHFVVETAVSTSGAALKWLSEIFGDVSYAEMDNLALTSRKGANGVVFSPDLSRQAAITGISLSSTRGDIVYALYEGICNDIKKAVGENVRQIKVFGGGSKSDIWCRILAETLQKEVAVMDTAETASLGAAILASHGSIACAKVINKINI